MSRPVPISVFDTSTFPENQQFEAWRESISPFLDISEGFVPPSGKFTGEFDSYLVASMIVGGTVFDAHDYERSSARIRRDGLNHWHLHLHLSGSFVGRAGERDIMAGANDITLWDFSQPFQVRSARSSLLVITVPRDALDTVLSPDVHHGCVLRGDTALGGLLGDHMRSLVARLPAMTRDESAAAASATAAMVAACFRPASAVAGRSAQNIAEPLGERIRRYFADHLDEAPKVQEICTHFGISRASLYRLFEDQGGVAAFIRNRKLSRAFTRLMSPNQRGLRIAEIALEAGYENEAHFSRAFRQAFDLTPSQVRGIADLDHADQEPVTRVISAWLAHMRRV